MRCTPAHLLPVLLLGLVACDSGVDDNNQGALDSSVDSAATPDSAAAPDSAATPDSAAAPDSAVARDSATDGGKQPKVGFEIMEIKLNGHIIAWAGQDKMTQAQFNAIKLSFGWFKNQPREMVTDGGTFARSPDGKKDGDFSDKKLYGYTWRHVATITKANQKLDSGGLLRGNTIAKYHTVSYNAGRSVPILVSPKGEQYALITRDANRKSDTHPLPTGWKLSKYLTKAKLEIKLPNPILNIRAKNEDSYQGPIPKLNLP
jgi:hypothetical protein